MWMGCLNTQKCNKTNLGIHHCRTTPSTTPSTFQRNSNLLSQQISLIYQTLKSHQYCYLIEYTLWYRYYSRCWMSIHCVLPYWQTMMVLSRHHPRLDWCVADSMHFRASVVVPALPILAPLQSAAHPLGSVNDLWTEVTLLHLLSYGCFWWYGMRATNSKELWLFGQETELPRELFHELLRFVPIAHRCYMNGCYWCSPMCSGVLPPQHLKLPWSWLIGVCSTSRVSLKLRIDICKRSKVEDGGAFPYLVNENDCCHRSGWRNVAVWMSLCLLKLIRTRSPMFIRETQRRQINL